jgi:hypothetical protein
MGMILRWSRHKLACLMTYPRHLDRCRGQTSRGCMSKREDRGAGPLQHFLEIDTGPAEGFQAKKHHDGLVKKYHGSQSVISRSFIVKVRMILAIFYSKAANLSTTVYQTTVYQTTVYQTTVYQSHDDTQSCFST